jgi:hypothetical protein
MSAASPLAETPAATPPAATARLPKLLPPSCRKLRLHFFPLL